jgi:hypothetical protein
LSDRPELLGFGLAALVVVGATILIAVGKTVPDPYWILAGVGIGGGAGVAFPKGLNTPTVDTAFGPAVPVAPVSPAPDTPPVIPPAPPVQ